MTHSNVPARRKLIRTLAATPAIGVAAYTSNSWVKPAIQTAILPAHAQTSEQSTETDNASTESVQPINVTGEFQFITADYFTNGVGALTTVIPMYGSTTIGAPNTIHATVEYTSNVGTMLQVIYIGVDSAGVQTQLTDNGSGTPIIQMAPMNVGLTEGLPIIYNGQQYIFSNNAIVDANQGSIYLTLDAEPYFP